MSMAGSVSPAVLRNRGVPMVVHATVPDADGKATDHRRYDDVGEYVMDPPRYIRFDNNTLSDIEDPDIGWGTIDAWEEALVTSPFRTVRATLALCWGFNPKDPAALRIVGAICPDANEEVGTLIGAAYMLANGMDPQLVGEAIRHSEIEQSVAAKATRERLAKVLNPDDSPTSLSDDTPTDGSPPESDATHGTTGSADGSLTDATLTSSGV